MYVTMPESSKQMNETEKKLDPELLQNALTHNATFFLIQYH